MGPGRKFNYNFSQYQSVTLTTNIQWRDHGNFFWWKSLSDATRPADSQLGGEVNSTRGNVSFVYKEILSDKFFYSLKAIYFGNFWQDNIYGEVGNTAASHTTKWKRRQPICLRRLKCLQAVSLRTTIESTLIFLGLIRVSAPDSFSRMKWRFFHLSN